MATFDITELEKRVEQKLIRKQKHPSADLYVYNYTAKAQYEMAWDDYTLQARGLILDGDGAIIARPFKKFFNFAEYSTDKLLQVIMNGYLNPLPFDLPFAALEKMDGSLGILYNLHGRPQLATRGSFTSEQAIEGTAILQEYLIANPKLEFLADKTYLFELIYPSNRIVVDYGTQRDIVLLGVQDTATGLPCEIDANHFPFPVVTQYATTTIDEVLKVQRDNAEGFVLLFADGTRCKVKHDEYIRLHKLLTGVSSKTVWELLSTNQPLESIIENTPDEFYEFVSRTAIDLRSAYTAIEHYTQNKLTAMPKFTERRLMAEYVVQTDYPAVLWKMIDGKAYDQIIWKLIKPKYEKPFKQDIDE